MCNCDSRMFCAVTSVIRQIPSDNSSLQEYYLYYLYGQGNFLLMFFFRNSSSKPAMRSRPASQVCPGVSPEVWMPRDIIKLMSSQQEYLDLPRG